MIEDARGNIDYNEEGAGPAIVFVPGSWGTRSAWRDVIEGLRGRFRIITTSLLGYGGTTERRTATHASIESEAEMVIQRAGGPVHLVGHSFGGEVCLEVAVRNLVPLFTLTLIEPTVIKLLHRAGELDLDDQVTVMRNDYFRAFEHGGDKQAARHVIDFFGGSGSFDVLPQRVRDYVVQTTATNILDWQCAMAAPQTAYSRISVATLILRGGNAHPALARSAELLRDTVPNASVVTVTGASHFMMATHAQRVAQLIGEHVDDGQRTHRRSGAAAPVKPSQNDS
jgi:pimeloyl-ACP methyl ester carboxylesterase